MLVLYLVTHAVGSLCVCVTQQWDLFEYSTTRKTSNPCMDTARLERLILFCLYVWADIGRQNDLCVGQAQILTKCSNVPSHRLPVVLKCLKSCKSNSSSDPD